MALACTDGSGTTAVPDAGAAPEGCGLPAADAQMRRLTRVEYENAVQDLLGVEPGLAIGLLEDESVGGFRANATAAVQALQVDRYASIAARIAEQVRLDEARLGCALTAPNCVAGFARRFARRAYRRPLRAEDEAALDALLGAVSDPETRARLAVEAVLQSPYFLYRPELGAPDATGATRGLSGFELASRLSFLLWATIPDEPLLQAAEAGRLATPEGLMAEADRLMASPRFDGALDGFHGQWLGLDRLDFTMKDGDEDIDDWSEARVAAKIETLAYTRELVLDGRSIADYFAPEEPYTYANFALADIYELEVEDDEIFEEDAFAWVPLDPEQRAGILTQVAFLATNAKASATSPVHRGEFVRKAVLCGHLSPPPPDVDTSLPSPPAGTTMREQLELHRSQEVCKGCHELMDPIGFTFEHFDAVGRYRDEEADRPVDARGYITGTQRTNGEFTDALQLSRHLARSDEVAACVSEKVFTYTFARPPSRNEACAVPVTSTASVRDLLRQFIASEAFRAVRVGS